MNPVRSIFISILFIFLVAFLWYAGLKPLYINRDINMADHYVRTGKCDKALNLMHSKIIYNPSTIDSYAKLKYISVIEQCNARSPEAINLLKEVAEIRPYYTRTYIFLGNYTGDKSYFDKASELSPNREEIFVGKMRIDLFNKDHFSVQEEAKKCIQVIPNSNYCWWQKAVSNLYLNNIEKGFNNLETAAEKGFNYYSRLYLSQIETACEANENLDCYNGLFEIYKKIIPQHFEEETFDEYKNLLIKFGGKANKIKELKQFLMDRFKINYD